MHVLFDVWGKFGVEANYSPEEQIAFEAIYNYIYDRIVFMWDEIEAEEKDETVQKAIVVYLLEKPMKIQPRGYSDKLHNRIVGCFNENDAELLWKSVANDLKRLLN